MWRDKPSLIQNYLDTKQHCIESMLDAGRHYCQCVKHGVFVCCNLGGSSSVRTYSLKYGIETALVNHDDPLHNIIYCLLNGSYTNWDKATAFEVRYKGDFTCHDKENVTNKLEDTSEDQRHCICLTVYNISLKNHSHETFTILHILLSM